MERGSFHPAHGASYARGVSEALRRRLRTIPRLLVTASALAALAPALLAAAVVVDVVRAAVSSRPFMSVRLLAFAFVYAWSEVVGLCWLFVAGPDVHRTYAIQRWWTGLLFTSVRVLFRLRFVVEGDECAGPRAVVLVRHASIIDTLLPSVFLTRAHGVKLRFVVKRELLEDPCLDVAGNRLPNHFVARRTEDTDADVAAVRALAAGCAADEAVLVYPEGTRFTEHRRDKALALLAQRSPELATRAQTLSRVLPPKPSGAFALLDGLPGADAVFLAHAGLEGFAHVADVFSGALVGRTVHVKMWRVPRDRIPEERGARTRWLYDEWQKVDAWISSQTSP